MKNEKIRLSSLLTINEVLIYDMLKIASENNLNKVAGCFKILSE